MMGVPRKLTAAQRAQVVELYVRHGMSATTLATRYGVGKTTIGTILREAGALSPASAPETSNRRQPHD